MAALRVTSRDFFTCEVDPSVSERCSDLASAAAAALASVGFTSDLFLVDFTAAGSGAVAVVVDVAVVLGVDLTGAAERSAVDEPPAGW